MTINYPSIKRVAECILLLEDHTMFSTTLLIEITIGIIMNEKFYPAMFFAFTFVLIIFGLILASEERLIEENPNAPIFGQPK